MAKFGRGLNREIVAAVNRGEIKEPFSTKDVRELVRRRGWATTEMHINVTLANAATDNHSPTYKKYFDAVGRGRYRLKAEFRGQEWR